MSGFFLGKRSRAELEGVHPSLVEVVEKAIVLTPIDFAVHDGLRTRAEQIEYMRTGVSQTLDSKHLPQADGFGHAVDLVPYVNGRLRWEWRPIYLIADAVRSVATDLRVTLRWGGCWDRTLDELGDLEMERDAYAERRRAAGLTAFLDGPHFELAP